MKLKLAAMMFALAMTSTLGITTTASAADTNAMQVSYAAKKPTAHKSMKAKRQAVKAKKAKSVKKSAKHNKRVTAKKSPVKKAN